MSYVRFIVSCIFVVLANVSICLANEENEEKAFYAFKAGTELEKNQRFSRAASKYLDASVYSDDSIVKMNSISFAARSYKKAKLYEKEFELLERLIKEHMTRIDYAGVVSREYEITKAFMDGHRDVIVSFLPILKGLDKSIEFAEIALKNAPCAEHAPEIRLRLGRMYMDEQNPMKAIEKYKEVISLHQGHEEAHYAQLELIHAYHQLAMRGDGDGFWSNLAIETVDDFISNNPNDSEMPWCIKVREQLDILVANRHHSLARYYHKTGRDDLARRHLNQLIQTYGNTEYSVESEQLLEKIDRNDISVAQQDKYYAPSKDLPTRQKRYQYQFEHSTIPIEGTDVLYSPENSDGKWLFPIKDINNDTIQDSRSDYEDKIDETSIY